MTLTAEQQRHLKKIAISHRKILRHQRSLVAARAELAVLLREGERLGCSQSRMAHAAGLTPGRVSQVTNKAAKDD